MPHAPAVAARRAAGDPRRHAAERAATAPGSSRRRRGDSPRRPRRRTGSWRCSPTSSGRRSPRSWDTRVLVRRGKLDEAGGRAGARGDRAKRADCRRSSSRISSTCPGSSRGRSGSDVEPVGPGPADRSGRSQASARRPRRRGSGSISCSIRRRPRSPAIRSACNRSCRTCSSTRSSSRPTGGRVEVRLEGRGPEVQIVVRDTGQRHPPEFLPYVFDRFRQDGHHRDAERTTGSASASRSCAHLVELAQRLHPAPRVPARARERPSP